MVINLGDDLFTVWRPHPMTDPSTRTDRIEEERDDAEIAVGILECVRGGHLCVIASDTVTAGNFQGFDLQKEKLEDADVIVMASRYQAAMLAPRIIAKITDAPAGGSVKAGATANAEAIEGILSGKPAIVGTITSEVLRS